MDIHTGQTRNEILELVNLKASENELALLSLYSYRQMDKIDWRPFLKAALERNPVSLEGSKGNSLLTEAYSMISALPNSSVYDSKRVALPDEVWNFGRGDGIEKAICLANFLFNETTVSNLTCEPWMVRMSC